MKKSLFFMPLVAAMALTGCSSDEPISPNGNFDGTYDGQAFMRIRISMPDDGTRATDGGFVNGSAEEHQVKTIGLKFYNADGSFYGYGLPVENANVSQTGNEGTTGQNIEANVTNAVIVLQINNNAPKPTHVVAFVNCGDDWKETIGAEPPIDQIDKTLNRIYSTYDETGDSKYFAMTSANFRTQGLGMQTFLQGYQTIIENTKFKATEAEALADGAPVDIYVERLAAKVGVKQAADLNSKNPAVNTNGYNLQFVIDGYALGGLNSESYLIKHIHERWDEAALWPGWSEPDNHRCYWALDINYDNPLNNPPGLLFYSYDEVKNGLAGTLAGTPMYSHENTLTTFENPENTGKTPQDAQGAPLLKDVTELNRYLFTEFVYVIGHYVVTKDGVPVTGEPKAEGEGKPDTYLYEYAGKIFPEDVMTTYMEQTIGDVIYRKTETGEGVEDIFTGVNMYTEGLVEIGSYNLTPQDEEWSSAYPDENNVRKDASLVCLHLTDKATDAELGKYYIKNPTPQAQTTDRYIQATRKDVNQLLKQSEVQAYGFKYEKNICGIEGNNGYLAYFPVLIKHLNSGEGKTEANRGYYGVVRNHIYNITINSIKGLGIGIYDPTVDIIPKDKLKPLYLGATFNILSWKVVNQTEDLQQ